LLISKLFIQKIEFIFLSLLIHDYHPFNSSFQILPGVFAAPYPLIESHYNKIVYDFSVFNFRILRQR